MTLPPSLPHIDTPTSGFALVTQEARWVASALLSPWLWAVVALAAGVAHWHFGLYPHPTPGGLAAVGLALLLAVASVVDLRLMVIPYTLNAVLLVSGLLVPPLAMGAGWLNTVAGALAAAGGLGFCAWLTTRLTGKPSLGGGDLLLVAALGAWVGASGLPPMMLVVALLGVLLVLVRLAGEVRAEVFPFGPLLALAGWVAFVGQGLYWQVMMGLYW